MRELQRGNESASPSVTEEVSGRILTWTPASRAGPGPLADVAPHRGLRFSSGAHAKRGLPGLAVVWRVSPAEPDHEGQGLTAEIHQAAWRVLCFCCIGDVISGLWGWVVPLQPTFPSSTHFSMARKFGPQLNLSWSLLGARLCARCFIRLPYSVCPKVPWGGAIPPLSHSGEDQVALSRPRAQAPEPTPHLPWNHHWPIALKSQHSEWPAGIRDPHTLHSLIYIFIFFWAWTRGQEPSRHWIQRY